MIKKTFAYQKCRLAANPAYPQGRDAYSPMIPATIIASNGEWMRCEVLPDSGADHCIFPLDFAKSLKIDVFNLPHAHTGGVGCNTNETYYDWLTIDLGDGINFYSLVGFTQGMNVHGIGLLGQAGFFEYYRVEFLLSQRCFTIETIETI
jgi:hypothetical protein